MNKALHCRPKWGFGHEPGCVLALPFKYLDGDSFTDSSVYGHLCTNYGSKWQLAGRFFDGVDDYVDCGNAPSLNITEAITIEAWVKASDTTDGPIVTKNYVTGGELPYDLRVQSGNAYFSTYQDGVQRFKIGKQMSANVWHHVVGTFNKALGSANAKIYVDGVLGETANYTGNLGVNAQNLRIGCYPYGATYFIGLIDEVRICNRTLSEEEGKAHFSGARVPK